MKSVTRLALYVLSALTALATPLASAPAQDQKPVGIVSVASIKENLADVAYITRAAGMADYGDTARFLVGAMTAGIDKERPIGLYFVPKEREFHAIAFVPMEANGLATIFKVQKDQLGEPRDVGDGVQEIGRARKVFIKEQGNWAFVAEQKEFLVDLPQDPSTILGDLPTKYNVAGKLMIQNIPAELRRTAIDEIKLGMERFLDSPAARQGKIDRDQARQLTGAYIANFERLLNEADQLLAGLAIDEQGKGIKLDIGIAAREGTSLAKSMALQLEARTDFAGFLQPDAAVTMIGAGKVSPEEVAQTRAALKAAQGQWSKLVDDSPDIPANLRDRIKTVLGQVLELADKNLSLGRIDLGATVMMLPGSLSFAAGGVVADGKAVENILKSLVDISKDTPNFPQPQLNAGSIGNVKLNRITVPLNNAPRELREAVGGDLEIIVGVGPQSVYVTGGKDAEALLKKVIDQSAQQNAKPVRPFEMVVSLLPILRFAKSMHEHPLLNGIVASLEQSGNDHVSIVSDPGQRTSIMRIEVQDGVIRAIGEGAKGAGAAGLRPPGR